MFGDKWAYGQIMKERDPSKQKALGRQVKNFNKEKWESKARQIVYKANYAKFTQHPDLYSFLMSTGDKHIVEASPTDRIWGIGMSASDRRIYDPDEWKGTNWLGEAIMQVRKELTAGIKQER
jgi:ribA/ribD-fused uncharacterized protein